MTDGELFILGLKYLYTVTVKTRSARKEIMGLTTGKRPIPKPSDLQIAPSGCFAHGNGTTNQIMIYNPIYPEDEQMVYTGPLSDNRDPRTGHDLPVKAATPLVGVPLEDTHTNTGHV